MSTLLTLKVWQISSDGGWAFAVYEGDGSEPGSLITASARSLLSDTLREGEQALDRALEIASCEHDYDEKHVCHKCGVYDLETQ